MPGYDNCQHQKEKTGDLDKNETHLPNGTEFGTALS